jgi:sulfopyruvate decarboxylase subunit alpha
LEKAVAEALLGEIKAAGIDFVACVPDSRLRDLYFLIREDPEIELVTLGNEGVAVCICGGAWLGGKHPLIMMENSGLRVASEYLARLGLSFGIPVMLLMSHRGAMGDGNWWAINHGVTMEPMLKSLRIPHTPIKRTEDIAGAFQKAQKTLQASLFPVALTLSGDLW